MSSGLLHASIVFPDPKDISGEEAWIRRCSLPVIAPWPPQTVETEGSLPQDALSTRLPSTLNALEEGEILQTQPRNHQPQTSETHSFLYSIPQWQPPSRQPTSKHSIKKPLHPCRGQRKTPSSARLQVLPPPLPILSRQMNSRSTQTKGVQPPLPTDLGVHEKVLGIYKKDLLDKTIGIRPRNKKSTEVRQIKSSQDTCGDKGTGLPPLMKIIIQQFMVANGFVYPYQHLTVSERPTFRNSLLVRLDLHNTFLLTKESDDEQKIIKSAWASIDGYVLEKSKEWKAQGVFEQASETARPTFAAFTKDWTNRKWDGISQVISGAMTLTTMLPMLSTSPDDPSRDPRAPESEKVGKANGQAIVVGDDTEASVDSAYAGSRPLLKRPSQDGHDTHSNKRVCNRDYIPITDNDNYADHVHSEEKSLECPTPEEKRLSIIIEAIHRAQVTMSDLAPMSANELATMQRDWASHGFPTTLADTLRIGQAYTAMMGKYFDHALELVSMLEVGSGQHWKADVGKKEVQVDDDACLEGGGGTSSSASSEQVQSERLSDPSEQLNWELEVRHLTSGKNLDLTEGAKERTSLSCRHLR